MSMSTDCCPYCNLSLIEHTENAIKVYTHEAKILRLEKALREIKSKAILSCDIGLEDFCTKALGGGE